MTDLTIYAESTQLVEQDSGGVREVLIRAGTSKNENHYGEDLLRAAAGKFENVQTYADHPADFRSERSIRDLTGWINNVSFDEDEKALIGTRHFTATAAGKDARGLAEAVIKGNAPEGLFGSSIYIAGSGTKDTESGVTTIDSIDEVFSVDDVTTPAAGGGFAKMAESVYAKKVELMKQESASEVVEVEASVEETVDWQSELNELRLEIKQLRHEQAAREHVSSLRLPAAWRENVYAQLVKADAADWDGIVEAEEAKAKEAPKSQSNTKEAAETLTEREGYPVGIAWRLPRAGENVRDYLARVGE